MIVKDAGLVRSLMNAKGISGRQLARDMGWSAHSYVNRILDGTTQTVSRSTAVKIASLLGVPVDLIFAPSVSGETRRTVRKVS
jgi:transcriptional regulator with XRE-family HTH domain